MRVAIINRIRLGLLFGWSWLPADETTSVEELNIYILFICVHITWGDE